VQICGCVLETRKRGGEPEALEAGPRPGQAKKSLSYPLAARRRPLRSAVMVLGYFRTVRIGIRFRGPRVPDKTVQM
jgi:hypothetical protein